MKRVRFFVILPMLTLLLAFQNDKGSSLAIDTENSDIEWTAHKVGGQHAGILKIKEGAVEFQDGTLSGGYLVMDMSSITCSDIAEEEKNAKLVGHLISEDFFNVEKHPTASFKITKVVPYGKGETTEEDEYELEIFKTTGELTIKGITKPIKAKIEIYTFDTSISISTSLEIDRSDYNIQYGSGSFFEGLGDKLIYDEIELTVNLSALLPEN